MGKVNRMQRNESIVEIANEFIEGRNASSEDENPYKVGSWPWALWNNGNMTKDKPLEDIFRLIREDSH